MEQLNSSALSLSSGGDPGASKKNAEVILERWTVELKPTTAILADDFGPILPTIYKKAIVFFRSLFTTTRLLPCWKFASQGPAKSSHPALTPRCRIRTSEPDSRGLDLLRHPIDGRPDPVTEYVFGDLDVPVGRLVTAVTYRNDCTFRIDDSEALLSSRFMGVDENFFKPSLQKGIGWRETAAEVGSLRDHYQRPSVNDLNQTYGSLSTFHGGGPLGTSPISALKAVKPPGSDTSSPPNSIPTHIDVGASGSLPISSRPATTRPPLRAGEGSSRRPSVSFQPFKAGSLSGSPVPRQVEHETPASPQSLSRPGAVPSLQQPRSRSSLTAGMPASLRGGPLVAAEAAAIPSSPRQATTSRYSSSFTHRRGRSSFGGTSRTGDDEQLSSGRQSLASSVAQPGSGLLAEAASSGSFQGDDNNITDFLKMLDSKKSLKSFDAPRTGESAANRTVAQLSKFHMMRESHNALTDSMTSSAQMQPSLASSGRQLGSVPGMVAPASMSLSSSPGKAVSPHTPHTPAIPSRLSEQSVVDESSPRRRATPRQGRPQEPTVPEASRENTLTQEASNAIDIPLSPRLVSYQRRSSSVAQRSRATHEDDDTDLAFAAHRSISLGADDREPPSMSNLLSGQPPMEEESCSMQENQTGGRQQTAEAQGSETSSLMQRGSTDDNVPEGFMSSMPSSSPFGRRRYTGMTAAAASRRQTPPQSSRGSFAGSVSRLARGGDDESINEEPLVFDLSEMDAQGRRSLEEGRGGGHTSSADKRIG